MGELGDLDRMLLEMQMRCHAHVLPVNHGFGPGRGRGMMQQPYPQVYCLTARLQHHCLPILRHTSAALLLGASLHGVPLAQGSDYRRTLIPSGHLAAMKPLHSLVWVILQALPFKSPPAPMPEPGVGMCRHYAIMHNFVVGAQLSKLKNSPMRKFEAGYISVLVDI